MNRLLRWLPAILLIAGLLGLWELYVDSGGVDNLILPAPHEIAKSLYTDRSLLWSSFLVTGKEILLGSLIAAAGGLLMAIAIHFSDTARRAIYPLLVGSQAIPVVLLAPALVYWLGFGLTPKLVVIAVVSFFSVVVTTLAGLAAVDPDLLKLMRTFDAPRHRTFTQVELPAALPGLFTGLKLTLVVAVIAAVLAEQSGGTNTGLGYLLLVSEGQLQSAREFAAATILFAFAISLFALLTLAERRLLPWAYQTRGDTNR